MEKWRRMRKTFESEQWCDAENSVEPTDSTNEAFFNSVEPQITISFLLTALRALLRFSSAAPLINLK